MHPILLNKKLIEILPANLYQALSPKGFIIVHWKAWLLGLIVAFIIAWWGLAPEAKGGRRAIGWLSTFVSFIFALLLTGFAVSRLKYIQLHTYGVLVAIGFLIGIILAVREAYRLGFDVERILDLAFWLLISAMVGARALYVFLHWNVYSVDFTNPQLRWFQWRIFRLWEGGLLYYGGFFLGLLIFYIFVKVNKLDFWALGDLIIPSIAIGQFFGYLGSFAAGFGYGIHTDVPWAVTFNQGAAVRGLPLHPTQLYGALGALFLFFVLLWLRSEKRYNGQVFLWYLLLFPVISYVIDTYTADASKTMLFTAMNNANGTGFNLSWSQGISVILFVVALFYLINRPSQASSSEATS